MCSAIILSLLFTLSIFYRGVGMFLSSPIRLLLFLITVSFHTLHAQESSPANNAAEISSPLDQAPPLSQKEAIIAERDELFMLATLAYLYERLQSYPKAGYDIGSLLAWDVEDTEHTPEFVIDHNRNFEMQGEIFHAEISTLQKAILKKQNGSIPSSISPRELYLDYTYRLAHATVYTFLEPCPMCAMTLLLARVPRVIYFMEDSGLRDPMTHEVKNPLPSESYGRKISTCLSSLPLALSVQKALYEEFLNDAPEIFPSTLHHHKGPHILDYIAAKGREIFQSAREQLFSTIAKHEENKKLLENIKQAIGTNAASSSACPYQTYAVPEKTTP